MLSKSKAKWIKSLQLKKYRLEEQCFIVQGRKGVAELLKSPFATHLVVGTPQALEALGASTPPLGEWIPCSEKELEQLGSFQSNDSVLAVARMRTFQFVPAPNRFYLALDDIRDPGNLGTIIRTADWFGIDQILASDTTADFYNPKTISATMGSFCRVQIVYGPLEHLLQELKMPVYGALLEGEPIHNVKFDKQGVVVIGNESNGISTPIKKLITHAVHIPGRGRAESLNAAIATGIILDNVFRGR